MENKIGYVVITTEEYKDLIIKEKDLDIAWEDYGELEEEKRILEIKLRKIEEELKELLLTITDNTTSFYNKEVHNYELIGVNEIADYITDNYLIDGKLQFRKVEETKEEKNNE